jgi:hypothetical protein
MKLSESRRALFAAHPEMKEELSVRRKIWHMKHPNFWKDLNNPMYKKGLECCGHTNPFFGHHHSLETRKRMSMSHLGKLMPDEVKKRISMTKRARIASRIIVYPSGEKHFWYGRRHLDATKLKISQANTGRRFSHDVNKKKGLPGKSNPFYGKKHTEDVLRRILQVVNARPNKFETAVQSYLNLNFPNEWKYCGDGSFIVNGKCPDFTNCNGKKEVILANGVYWHAGCNKPSLAKKRIIERVESKPYKEFGFKVHFIWEDDFKSKFGSSG